MLKKLSVILAAMMLVTSISVSFTASAEKLASSETGKAVVFSCDDGVYTGIDGSYINIVDGSVEGDMVHTPGGRSVKWKAGTLYLSLTGKGVTQIPNKKYLCIRVYNPGTEILRTNIKIYDGAEKDLKVHKSYPIVPYTDRNDECNGWDTIKVNISDVTNWPDNADADISVSLSRVDKTVYVDSAWIEYTPTSLTQKYDKDSVCLFDLGSSEFQAALKEDSAYLTSFSGGSFQEQVVDGEADYSYEWNANGGGCKLRMARFYKAGAKISDYTGQGYDLCFRLKASTESGNPLPVNLYFSNTYLSSPGNHQAAKTFYVETNEWKDYYLPLDDVSAAVIQSGDNAGYISTVLWQSGAAAENNSKLYIDRIFLAKQQSTETLSAPNITLADTDVNRYLQGGNKVNFTFDENLKTTGVDYVSAVTVQKNGETTRDGIAVSVSGNTLSVISADALDSSAEYTVTLNKDYIVSADGKKMESNYTKTFTTAAEACMIKNVNATASGAAGVISNNTTRGRNYVVVLSAYKDNLLKSVKLVPEWVSPMSEENIDAAFDIDVSECDTFKAFVWNSLDSMVPFENR